MLIIWNISWYTSFRIACTSVSNMVLCEQYDKITWKKYIWKNIKYSNIWLINALNECLYDCSMHDYPQ